MSIVSPSAFSYNSDSHLIGVNRYQSGHPDECTAQLAEMNAALGYDRQPDEAEIDRMYEEHMRQLDDAAVLEELASLQPAEDIQLSIGMTTGNKFAAAVRMGGKVYKLGAFKLESSAWIAAQNKASQLRNELALLA